jgi:hypothetical protein
MAWMVLESGSCADGLTKIGRNMIYKVKARVIDETIGEFYCKLADGSVAKQRPDGEEIVASMKRAVLTGPGMAEWYEMCFLPHALIS